MGVQPTNLYTLLSSIAKSPQERQRFSIDTPVSTASTANAADEVIISQAASDHVAEGMNGSGVYDFTHMTPRQTAAVAQDLHDSGKIDNQQHLMLLTPGLTFGGMRDDGQYMHPSHEAIARRLNTPINYLQYSQDRISFLESAGLTADPQYGYEGWKGILGTLQEMSSSSVA